MYKVPTDVDFTIDFNARKEFAYYTDSKPTPGVEFEFKPSQHVVKQYVTPFTENKRILVAQGTGSGKTSVGLLCGKSFIDQNRSAVVLCFNKERFYEEALKYPHLGFITEEESIIFARMQVQAHDIHHTPNQVKAYKEYKLRLRRRLRGFKFYGYNQFANMILGLNGIDDPEINFDTVESLRHGIIICDEIHNVYNTTSKNNWGEAIQLVINLLGNDIYIIYMSATPLSSSTEIQTTLQLLHKTEEKHDLREYAQALPTEHHRILSHILEYKPIELTEANIAAAIRGKIIYLPSVHSESIPERIIEGEAIPGIKYLKFIRTPLSECQREVYSHLAEPEHVMQQYHRDIAFDLPINKLTGQPYIFKDFIISESPESKAWLAERSIEPTFEHGHVILKGNFMQRESLRRYSEKYVKILDDTIAAEGKVIIYHHFVRMQGATFFLDMFRNNNVIGENDTAFDNTLCAVCARPKIEHTVTVSAASRPYTSITAAVNRAAPTLIPYVAVDKDPKKHAFRPMRFTILHSDLSDALYEQSYQRFNATSNKEGYDIKILIGSRAIRESIDFKAARNIFISSIPIYITWLIQVLGRGIRTGSHLSLPLDQRNVKVRIYVSSWLDGSGRLTPEEQDYFNKMLDYIEVQRFENIMYKNAVDAYILKTDELVAGIPADTLGPQPFTLPTLAIPPVAELKTSTYVALRYYQDELVTCTAIVRHLLRTNPVWHIDKMWDAVVASPGTPNPKYFDRRNLAIVLKKVAVVLGEYIVRRGNGNGTTSTTSIVDVESFIRDKSIATTDILLDMDMYKIAEIVIALKTVRINSLVELCEFLEQYPLSQHYRTIEHLIKDDGPAHKHAPLLAKYAYGFQFVTIDVGKQSTLLAPEDLTTTTPSGYYTSRAIIHLTPSGWSTYLASQPTLPENDIILGMYSDDMTFKYRPPLRRLNTKDRRMMYKGATCVTRPKEELAALAKALKLPVYKHQHNTVKSICGLIKAELIRREQDHTGGKKWFYLY